MNRFIHGLINSIAPHRTAYIAYIAFSSCCQVLRNVSNWTYNAQMEIAEAGQDPNTHYQQRGMWGRFVGQLFGMLNDPRGGGRSPFDRREHGRRGGGRDAAAGGGKNEVQGWRLGPCGRHRLTESLPLALAN